MAKEASLAEGAGKGAGENQQQQLQQQQQKQSTSGAQMAADEAERIALKWASEGVYLRETDKLSSVLTDSKNKWLAKPLVRCVFCIKGLPLPQLDYKNTKLLGRFVSEAGRIMSSKRTGLCKKHARKVAKVIKRSRATCYLPYLSRVPMTNPENRVFSPPSFSSSRGGVPNMPANYFAYRHQSILATPGDISRPKKQLQ